MSLKNLAFTRPTIETSGGSFTVRGLSLPDIGFLFARHGSQLESIYAKFTAGDEESVSTDAIKSLMTDAGPELVAEVIALAASDSIADFEETILVAKDLPFPVQIDALSKIGGETFRSEEDLKNVIAVVVQMFSKGTKAIQSLRT